MELIYVKNFNCILLWITIFAIIISTATALTTEPEADDNSLNTNLNEEDEGEFDIPNLASIYSLRFNPNYYGRLQHFMNKRIKGSEFLDVAKTTDIYGSQKPKTLSKFLADRQKRLSEFLSCPGKRLSEFLGGPGKRKVGCALAPRYFLAKKLSDYLNSSHKRPVRFTDQFIDFLNPRGSEFLGGPGKRLSEFLGGQSKRKVGGALAPSYFLAKKLSDFLNSSYKRPVRFADRFIDFYNPRGSEFLGGPGK